MLWAVVILKHLSCLSEGFQCLFSIWTHTCSHFFRRQLAPAGLHSDLNAAGTDWHWMNLLTDSRCTIRKTQTQNLKLTQIAATQHTGLLYFVHYLQRIHSVLAAAYASAAYLPPSLPSSLPLSLSPSSLPLRLPACLPSCLPACLSLRWWMVSCGGGVAGCQTSRSHLLDSGKYPSKYPTYASKYPMYSTYLPI